MNKILIALSAFTLIGAARATSIQTYALSPDGLAVVRLVSSSSASASTFDSSLLPNGYTSSTATGGAVKVTSYTAGYKNGNGGGEIKALFTPATAPAAGQALRWIQIGSDNDPLPGFPSPYLDSQSGVFYDWAGSVTPLSSGQLPFYDFSNRSPQHLSNTDPITWNASLYPTVVDSNKHIEVHDGVTWGWTMKKAPVGTTSGIFKNPSPTGATVSGVGTNNFTWGSGSPSSLSFTGTAFDTTPGTKFKLGTLTFHNGAIDSGSGADSVDFQLPINFTNVPELNTSLKTTLGLINTVNTDDPTASADEVTLGNFGYTFHVLEEQTASVDIMATLDTMLTATPNGVNGAPFDDTPFDISPVFSISDISFANPTSGGFVTTPVPEPSMFLLLLLGVALAWTRKIFTQDRKTFNSR